MNRNEKIYKRILKKSVDENRVFSKAKFDKMLQTKMAKDNEFAVFYHLNFNADDINERQTIANRIKEKNAKILKKIEWFDSSKVIKSMFGIATASALAGIALVVAGACSDGAVGTGLSASGVGVIGAAQFGAIGCTAAMRVLGYQKLKNDMFLEKLNENDQKEDDAIFAEDEIIAEQPDEIGC